MVFRGMEVDFDVFDADTADAYEAAAKRVRDEPKQIDGESFGDYIRRQCRAIFAFFDSLFGEDFHKEIFGTSTNLMTCLDAYAEFNAAAGEQRSRLEELTQRTQTLQPQRKAAARVVR